MKQELIKKRVSRRPGVRSDTRQALVLGGLKLLDGNKSFDGLSLRELTRSVGVVPTAFYRHFKDMPELGQAMVEEAFLALRKILQDVRHETKAGEINVSGLMKSLMQSVGKRRRHFRFIVAERYSGDAGVRRSVRRELRVVQAELATDLAQLKLFSTWDTEELQMAAGAILNQLLAVADDILEQTRPGEKLKPEMMRLAEQQLRLILLGVPHWRSPAKG